MKKFKVNYSWIYDKIQELYSLSSYYLGNGKAFLPLRYTLELTYRCNLNCDYCYVGKTKNTEELSTWEWFDIIDQIPKYRLITLVGGEVLIRNDFKDILNKCLDKGKVNIVTNATLFNDELLNIFVDKKLLLLNISIDGIGENHDINRGHKGTFDKVVKNLENLIRIKGNKKYPMIDIKTVILKNNLDDLVEIYKLADYFKADFFTPSFLKESDLQQNAYLRENFSEEFYKKHYPINPYFDIEHFFEVYREIQSLSKTMKPVIRFYPKFKSFDNFLRIKKFYSSDVNKSVQELYYPCLYPWANILITPKGDVYPCLSYKIGNVKNTPIQEVWNNSKFIEFRKNLKKNKVFTSCQCCCQLKIRN